ncbi:hypothetical protein [Bradyrhizobium macuxiense]|nr:hypothetical protein [Bradyrhizobium macuxiense]
MLWLLKSGQYDDLGRAVTADEPGHAQSRSKM